MSQSSGVEIFEIFKFSDCITCICFACNYTFKRVMQLLFFTHSIQNQVIYNLTINCLSLSHDRLLQSLCYNHDCMLHVKHCSCCTLMKITIHVYL